MAKNKLKLLRCRDSSDQSQRKGETVDQNRRFQYGNLSLCLFSREVLLQSLYATSLEVKPFWLIKWFPIGVNPVAMDKGHIVLHSCRRDQKFNESSGVVILEPSKSIRCVLIFSEEPVAKEIQVSSLGERDLLMQTTEERFTRNLQHGASKSGQEWIFIGWLR